MPPLHSAEEQKKKAPLPMKNVGEQGGNPLGDALAAHNTIRAKHNMPKLSLDKKLCKFAQEHADYMLGMGKSVKASHSKYAQKYGEGVQIIAKLKYPIATVINSWYTDEYPKFNWNVRNYTEGCGHMTQIIWKETKRLGVGYATDKKPDRTIVVLLYDPTGNVYHTFRENVHPVGAKK